MSSLLGVDLLSLFGLPVSITSVPSGGPLALPPEVTRFLAKLSVLSYETSVSDRRILHHGLIQTGIQDAVESSNPGEWPLRIPGLFETGLPFRLLLERAPIASGEQIEGTPPTWVLQIYATEISVQLPFKRAVFHGETATAPAYLTPDTSTAKPVLTVDAGVVEITSGGDVRIRPDFTMSPNPYSGALIRLRFTPKNVFIIDRVLGVRAGEVIIDLSELVSPVAAQRAGFGPTWKGVFLEELGFYFPRDTPFFVPKSITLKDALIGDGFAGEGILEMGDAAEPPPRPTFLHVVDQDTTPLTIGDHSIVEVPFTGEATGLSISTRLVAVADLRDPWAGRRTQARWILPDGSRHSGARTGILSVRPGDTIEYFYEPPNADETFESPSRQVYMFQAAGPYPRGATARLQLRWGVTTGMSDAEAARRTFNDVVHVNAPLDWYRQAQLRAVDESGNPLGTTVASNWTVGFEPAIADEHATVNLAHFVAPALMSFEGDRMLPRRRLGLRVGLTAEGVRRFALFDILADRRHASFNAIIVSELREAGDSRVYRAQEIDTATLNRTEIPLQDPIGHVFHLQSALGVGQLRELDDRHPPVPPGSDGRTLLFPGRLYEVNPVSQGTEPVPPPDRTPPYRVSFFFETDEFGESHITGYATTNDDAHEPPYSTTPNINPRAVLRGILTDLRSGMIDVVGRSSTSADPGPGLRSSRNQGLAVNRTNTGLAMTRAVLADLGRSGTVTVAGRDEVDHPANPAEWPANPAQHDRHLRTDRAGGGVDPHAGEADHLPSQRVDLFLVPDPVRTASQWEPLPAPPPTAFSEERRALIPVVNQPSTPPAEYRLSDATLRRLRLAARWDRDPFPVKMEILAVLRTSSVSVRTGTGGAGSGGEPITIPDDAITSDEDFWRFILRLVHDARSGRSRWSLVFDAAGESDGLFTLGPLPDVLGTLFVFAPLFARRAQAEAADGSAVDAGSWVALSVLLAVGIAAEVLDVIRDVKVIVNGFEIDLDTRNGPFDDFEAITLKVDYSVQFQVRIPLLNLRTRSDRPVRIRYRNIGVALTDPIENSHVLFEDDQGGNIALEDAGAFEQDSSSSTPNILGNLVQVVGARLGQGSTFIELDLKFTIDIGVIEVKQTTVRLVIKEDGGLDFQVRGLGVKLDIPGTLVGEGALALRDNGFSARLALEVVPAKLKAAGSLDFYDETDFKAVAVGLSVEFPAGLPLAATGLGIFGFLGYFAANMTRDVPDMPDPISAELTWLGRLLTPGSADPSASGSVWRVQRDSWAFGIGAVVGTLPDGAQSFHAKGALVVEIPGPTIIFGIDARFLQSRRNVQGGDDVSADSTIRGLIGLTPEAFMIGIDVDLRVVDLLRVKIPIRALFPLEVEVEREGALVRERAAAYLRIGSDGVDPGDGTPARAGGSISVELNIGSFLELRAFAFLMLEERSLHKLGGKEELTFDGFSVGFGLGISLFLGSRDVNIYLDASALLLAGIGTSPLVIGGLFEVHGTLAILILSLSVSARLEFLHRQPGPRLPPDSGATDPPLTSAQTTFEGEFCGEIQILFFTIRACVNFRIGDGDPFAVPEPPPLVTGVSFMDRRGFETTKLSLDEAGTVVGEATVWPDTVPVLHLRSEPELGLAPAGPFASGLTSLDHAAEVSVGDFQYAFTLADLQLEKAGAGGGWEPVPGPLDAAFWLPSFRPAFLPAEDIVRPSDTTRFGEEVRELGLLTWQPAPWTRALVLDGHGPAVGDIERGMASLCEAPSGELRDCAYFESAAPDPARVSWHADGQAGRAGATAEAQGGGAFTLARRIGTLLAVAGTSYLPMETVTWPPARVVAGRATAGALRLAQMLVRRAEGTPPGEILRTLTTFETLIALDRRQYDGSLVLAVSKADFGQQPMTVPLADGAHGAHITAAAASVVARTEDGLLHVVEGSRLGEITLDDGESYTLYEFSTRRSVGRTGVVNAWIVPPVRADVQVVQLCGYDEQARRDLAAANSRRERARARLREISERPDGSPSQFILDADSRYRVRASWGWRGHHKEHPEAPRTGPRPLEQRFEFRAAPAFVAGAVPETRNQVAGADIDQRTFDVRDLGQYVTELPRFEAPPWFLDDPLSAKFSVNYLETLLDRYGRTLSLSVDRTDAPVPADAAPVITAIHWRAMLADEAEQMILAAITAQPCLPDAIPGTGRQGLIEADLAPLGRYDLSVRGRARDGTPGDRVDDDTLIARAPFLASRYRSPAELLASAGFASDGHPTFVLPRDVVLAADAVPAAAPPARDPSDVDLAEALAAYGLADYDAPDSPRTTVIWAPPLPVAPPREPARPRTPVIPIDPGLVGGMPLPVVPVPLPGPGPLPGPVPLPGIGPGPRLPGVASTVGLGSLVGSLSSTTRPLLAAATKVPLLPQQPLGTLVSAAAQRSSGLLAGAIITPIARSTAGSAPPVVTSAATTPGAGRSPAIGSPATAATDVITTGLPTLIDPRLRINRSPLGPLRRTPTAPPPGWRVVAVLVESDEPVTRSGVLALGDLVVQPVGARLRYARASSNGSRVLFTAAAPIEVGNQQLSLALSYVHTRLEVGADGIGPVAHPGSGSHPLLAVPETVRWEV